MRIFLSSNNNSKKRAIEIALNSLELIDYTIELIPTESFVSSKPIDNEIVNGAINRNDNLLKHCLGNNIDFDLLISIEGGYEQIDNYYFIVTYASIFDANGNMYLGKSQGLQITEKMFEWVKNGNSLNKAIEEVLAINCNKEGNGISGYLTSGYYKRDEFDSSAVVSAMQTMINKDKYKTLNKYLKI